jgi:hypothetical protein
MTMLAFDVDGALEIASRLMQFIGNNLSVLVGLILAAWIVSIVIAVIQQKQT